MTRIHLPALCLALAACAGAPAATGPGPAPVRRAHGPLAPLRYGPGGPWGYRLTRQDTMYVTLPNGDRQIQVLDRMLTFRWNVTAGAGGGELVITVDSVRLGGLPDALRRALEDSTRGAVLRGPLAADGRGMALSVAPDNPVTQASAATVTWLLPALPGVTAADTLGVTDTLRGTTRFNVVDAAEVTVRQQRAVAADSAWLVTAEATLTRDGVSPDLTLTGSGARWGTTLVEPDGRILAASGRDSVAMSITVPSMGQQFSILQFTTYQLTPLP
ncbi:MAG TPA: hypothetical protein VFS07_01895 [Gemmatimonadales bacterium]|nr:hypothetical protein [Gemmatimonadales bacterium]